jgi:8-oxo-dGTP pyrophosphatase MutT (NUDIX family)
LPASSTIAAITSGATILDPFWKPLLLSICPSSVGAGSVAAAIRLMVAASPGGRPGVSKELGKFLETGNPAAAGTGTGPPRGLQVDDRSVPGEGAAMADPRFDPPPSPLGRPASPSGRPARSLRPKDAATLILVRRDLGEPRILMGQRSKGHVFMPDKWVFPGGRVDPADGRAPAAAELSADVERQLSVASVKRKARAFALTAVRETFEETGLVVGRAGTLAGRVPASWAEYAAHGAAPDLSRFSFLGRAITPPARPRRFDARFFYAEADDVLLDDRPHASGEELLHVEWFTLEEAEALDLPSVTRFVIGEVRRKIAGQAGEPPFLRWRGSRI